MWLMWKQGVAGSIRFLAKAQYFIFFLTSLGLKLSEDH